MYFKCKSCGSNDYFVKKNQIICNHCGGSYLYDGKTVEKKSDNRLLIPLVSLVVVGLVFIYNQKDKEITKIKQKIEKVSKPPENTLININNTNAQIGTQTINIDKNIKDSDYYTPFIENKNRNFTEQKIEYFIDKNGVRTMTVDTSGFNKKDNTLYLDKKGVIPLLAQAGLPSGVVSHVKVSKDATKLFYVSRYDVLYIVDIKQLDKPKVLAKIELENINDVLLSKDENKLYLNIKDELSIFDITDKLEPKKLGNIPAKPYYRDMVLSQKDKKGVINHINYQATWHKFYKRIRDIEVTPNGKYIAFIANKNSISFKRFEVTLPKVDKDSLYDKDDYFGHYYSSIVQPNIDEIKEITISKDGTKLFAFSSSDVFVYDIRKLLF